MLNPRIHLYQILLLSVLLFSCSVLRFSMSRLFSLFKLFELSVSSQKKGLKPFSLEHKVQCKKTLLIFDLLLCSVL